MSFIDRVVETLFEEIDKINVSANNIVKILTEGNKSFEMIINVKLIHILHGMGFTHNIIYTVGFHMEKTDEIVNPVEVFLTNWHLDEIDEFIYKTWGKHYVTVITAINSYAYNRDFMLPSELSPAKYECSKGIMSDIHSGYFETLDHGVKYTNITLGHTNKGKNICLENMSYGECDEYVAEIEKHGPLYTTYMFPKK